MAGYQKNTWVIYDSGIPKHEQPDAFITKAKLDNIENGIGNAITDFQVGTVSKGTDARCEIIADENNPSIKRINMVIPKEVSWSFSEAELHDKSVAPIGISINDFILDIKGNIFTIIENENGVYILDKKMNIKGDRGEEGEIGPDGKPGQDGEDGKDGQDGNKLMYNNKNLFDGEEAPDGANVGDFVFDNDADVFEVMDDLRLRKVFNIRGTEGPRGPAGLSTYDLWKSLGNSGDAEDFLNSLRGQDGAVKAIDSLDSTSVTDALSANQGRILKDNRLTTLDEILANEEEGIFVDALAIKELYLKMQELLANI